MDLSDAYENGAYIPDAETYITGWPRAAAIYRAGLGAQFVGGFDPETRQGADLVLPEGRPKGLFIFVHGGYWRAFSPRDWTHLARGAVAAGWAVALPGYPLCPDVRISQITQVVAEGITDAADQIDGPVVLTGHSAGGHLVVRMLESLPNDLRARIARVAPISMLSDLAPLVHTKLNEILGLDANEAQAESPLNYSKPDGVELAVWVGADERPAFIDQSTWLAEKWNLPLHISPGMHHFNVVEGLENSDSDLIRWLTKG